MAKNPWTLVALALTTAGAIAAAAPQSSATPQTSSPALQTRPASPELICRDTKIGATFGGDPKGCREYLDSCLDELTTTQRAAWHRSVSACIDDQTQPLYSCYAQVPWC